MADLQKIVDELSTLTVLEAADLAKMLEEKWGVSAAAAVAVAAGPAGAAAGGAAAEEKTEFTEVLASAGEKKIEVTLVPAGGSVRGAGGVALGDPEPGLHDVGIELPAGASHQLGAGLLDRNGIPVDARLRR